MPDAAAPGLYIGGTHTNQTTECFHVTGNTAVGGVPALPAVLVSPNPVRSRLRILCPALGGERAFAEVLDVGGRVRRRLSLDALAGGARLGQWDLRDALGVEVRSGVYLIRIVRSGGPPVSTRIAVVH